ncbi:hypothetical protein BDV96DRAFT_286757 [Lophiotrema nucula]|uniref:Uncharacterized protein n=1 Tax=Lophiotrema nucula TaxID=690887 RepID=A0A6A5YMU1_9PLEO|nr:hypothetical protein BDV96DRAFT_286757 [Lophiotrema nucula]
MSRCARRSALKKQFLDLIWFYSCCGAGSNVTVKIFQELARGSSGDWNIVIRADFKSYRMTKYAVLSVAAPSSKYPSSAFHGNKRARPYHPNRRKSVRLTANTMTRNSPRHYVRGCQMYPVARIRSILRVMGRKIVRYAVEEKGYRLDW